MWLTDEGRAAIAYANNNLALAKAFLAGYYHAFPEKRKSFKAHFQQVDIADDPVRVDGGSVDFTDDDASFDVWWSLYAKKRSRKKCFTKWQRMSVRQRADCIRATPAYVESTPDKQYRKDPSTYLNNESYYDEIIPRKNEKGFDPYAKAASILSE